MSTAPGNARKVKRLLDTVRSLKQEQSVPGHPSRRNFIQVSTLAGAAASLAAAGAVPAAQAHENVPTSLNEATIAHLQALMAAGHLTSAALVDYYLERIQRLDKSGPTVNSV